MPLFLNDVGSTSAGKLGATAHSSSVATTTASAMSGVKYNIGILACLRGKVIHPPPGPCPYHTRKSGYVTKTQVATKRKMDKATKAKATEDKRLLAASRKIEMMAKRQDKLISSA